MASAIELRQIVRSSANVAVDPAADLALHVAVGPADLAQTGRSPVHAVQLDQHLHQRLGNRTMQAGSATQSAGRS